MAVVLGHGVVEVFGCSVFGEVAGTDEETTGYVSTVVALLEVGPVKLIEGPFEIVVVTLTIVVRVVSAGEEFVPVRNVVGQGTVIFTVVFMEEP